jgi:predicted esterase YcpF (UPF0227 family)
LLPPLPKVNHANYFSVTDVKLPDNEGSLRVFVDGLEVNAYVKRSVSKRLILMFPGASSRAKGYIDFQRYSWAENFDANVVVFSDPTMTASNNITLGWFQGTVSNFGITAVRLLICKIIDELGIAENDVLFFGSSAGGFTSLKLAEHFAFANVIAINPQLYLYNYTRSFYEKMLAYSYAGLSEQQVLAEYKDRLVVKHSIVNTNRQITIFQNKHDERHLNRHLNHFLQGVDQVNRVEEPDCFKVQSGMNVVIYDDKESGHAPPDRIVTLKYINSICEWIIDDELC